MNTNYNWRLPSPQVTSSLSRNPLDADSAADNPAGSVDLSIQDGFHGSARPSAMFASWFCSTKPYHCD